MVVGKPQTTKTGSRDVTSGWARSRKAIATQWRNDIDTKKMEVEGTLYIDEHSEFCMLGEGHITDRVEDPSGGRTSKTGFIVTRGMAAS